MQIISPQIDVSEIVSTNNPRAERLLSPNVVQLDMRAFEARSAEPNFSARKAYVPLFLALVILVILAANWMYRPDIYPTIETAIAAQTPVFLPLPVALEVSDVELRKISVNRKKIVLVVGHIINRSGKRLPIPQLNIVLRQKDGQNVISWRYRPQQASLKAGSSLRFTSKFSTDVKDGSVVEIQFVSRDDR